MVKGVGFFLNFVKPFFWLLGAVCPRKRGLVVFAQAKGRFSDNSKALFQWMSENSEREVIWLYSGENLEHPREACPGGRFHYRDSLAGLWLSLRADVVILSHGFNDFGFWKHAIRRKRILLLWHAITVKSVGLTDNKSSLAEKRRYRRKETRDLDAVISSSDIDRYHVAAYMGVDVNRVHVTGLPRHDPVFHGRSGNRETKDVVDVIYAPTFRDRHMDCSSLFFPFPDYDADTLADHLMESGIRIWLRPHPNDRKSLEHVLQLTRRKEGVFVSATSEDHIDINALLPDFDVVVTDYSSIFLDLLPYDVPCLFVPFDIDSYLKDRGLGYDYELVAPGPGIFRQDQFIAALEEAKTGMPEWKEHRKFVERMLVPRVDGNCCRRTAAVVDQLLET